MKCHKPILEKNQCRGERKKKKQISVPPRGNKIVRWYWPADKFGCYFAYYTSGRAPPGMREGPRLVGRGGGRPIVGGGAALAQLLPVEGAAAGAAAGKAGAVGGRGANTVSRWRRSRHALGCAAETQEDALRRVTTENSFAHAKNC